MADSVWESCVDAVAECVERLRRDGKLLGLEPESIVRRKLPQAGEALDALPLVCVCPHGQEGYEEAHSEGGADLAYPVLVAVVSAGNRKLRVAGNRQMPWRELIRRAVRGLEAADLPGAWRVQVEPEPAFDRAALAANYDYGGVLFRLTAGESATGD